ncbi:MAG: hypothetical protein ABIJ09_17560 [Pseudomonadota bacterium]
MEASLTARRHLQECDADNPPPERRRSPRRHNARATTALSLLAALSCTPAVGPDGAERDAGAADKGWFDAGGRDSEDAASLRDGPGPDIADGSPGDAMVDSGSRDVATVDRAPVECAAPPPLAPTCPIVDVDGLAAEGPVRPGQVARLDATLLFPGQSLAASDVRWHVLWAPPLSRVSLWPAAGAQTRLLVEPSGIFNTYLLGVGDVGSYVVEATLGGGAQSASCELQVAVPMGLYVQASREVGNPDVELVLLKEDDQQRFCLAASVLDNVDLSGLAWWCSDEEGLRSTCYLGNCEGGAGPVPDWDGDQVQGSAGDPRIALRDRLSGYPEAIHVPQPGAGRYLVGALIWSTGGGSPPPVSTQIRVYADGQLLAAAQNDLSPRTFWEPFVVEWPQPASGTPCAMLPPDTTRGCLAPTGQPACSAAQPCGPGARCDLGRSRCIPAVPCCDSALQCDPGQACEPASQTCAVGWCTPEQACVDAHRQCVAETLSCSGQYLPCEGEHEPDDTLATATQVLQLPYGDTACLGNDDFLEIPVHAGTRLRVPVHFTSANQSQTDGIEGRLYNLQGVELQRVTINQRYELRLEQDIDADGSLVVLVRNRSTAVASQPYELTILETSILDCANDPGEPNDSLELASQSPLEAGSHDLLMCGVQDTDHYAIKVPASNQLRTHLSFEPTDGSLHQTLLDASGTRLHTHDDGPMSSTHLHYKAQGSDENVVLRIRRSTVIDDDLPYHLELELVDCQDGHEPNDDRDSAVRLEPGTFQGNLCDEAELDFFALDTAVGGSLSVTFQALSGQGIDVTLFDADGMRIDGNTSRGTATTLTRDNLTGSRYVIEVESENDLLPLDRILYSLTVDVAPHVDAGVDGG